ncbi:MAG TPA: rod-binding protein [Acidisphaera sp.]|nr:rod-binding protein [Acidisphaera sp.]
MAVIPATTTDPTAGLPPAQAAQLKKAAHDFEAMAINELLKPMFDTVDTSGGPFGGGAAEQTWRPMMVEAMAKQMEQAGGLGLSQPVLESLVRAQAARGDINRGSNE